MRALALLVLTACLARPTSDFTWRDAWTEEASSWCDYELRCMPEWFYNHFPDHATCVYVEVARVCEQKATSATETCDDHYPGRLQPALARCSVELETLGCGALFPPDSCFEAFP